MIADDLMNVRWPVDENRRDALSEMIDYCLKALLSCTRLEEYLLRQDDERLTTTIDVIHRHAKICCDMLKTLLNWESHYPEEVRAAVEAFGLECEFASLELGEHLPEWTSEAHTERLLPATEGTIRTEHAVIAACLSSCLEFARVWFGIHL